MAGDWLPMHLGLEEEPEVVRIVSAICPQSCGHLSARLDAVNRVCGALFRTWRLFDQLTDDGILYGYTSEWLDTSIGIENWSENLQHVGWLEITPQSLIMPNFERWLGHSAKRRLKDSKRKKERRRSPQKNVRKMSADCPQNVRKSADKKRTTGQDRTGQINKPPVVPQGGRRSIDLKNKQKSADAVFDEYKKFHPRSKFGAKEKRKVLDRLSEGFSVEDLAQAILGLHSSKFHLGENEQGRKYLSLELCMRDATHVNQFIEIANDGSQQSGAKKSEQRRAELAKRQEANKRKLAARESYESSQNYLTRLAEAEERLNGEH